MVTIRRLRGSCGASRCRVGALLRQLSGQTSELENLYLFNLRIAPTGPSDFTIFASMVRILADQTKTFHGNPECRF